MGVSKTLEEKNLVNVESGISMGFSSKGHSAKADWPLIPWESKSFTFNFYEEAGRLCRLSI